MLSFHLINYINLIFTRSAESYVNQFKQFAITVDLFSFYRGYTLKAKN